MRAVMAGGGFSSHNLKSVCGQELNFGSLGADAPDSCSRHRAGWKIKPVFTTGPGASIQRMTDHPKKPQEKTILPFKWVDSEPFDLKLVIRTGAGASPTSDTAFLNHSKLLDRDHRIPRS